MLIKAAKRYDFVPISRRKLSMYLYHSPVFAEPSAFSIQRASSLPLDTFTPRGVVTSCSSKSIACPSLPTDNAIKLYITEIIPVPEILVGAIQLKGHVCSDLFTYLFIYLGPGVA